MPKENVSEQAAVDYAALKDKSGELLHKGGSIYTIKLVGKRGTGKSRFYLSMLRYKAEELARNEFQREIDWKKPEDNAWVKENISPKIMMRIIDFDISGIEKLLERPDIVPSSLMGCIRKWGITGVPGQMTAYEEAKMSLEHYLGQLLEHAEKYPEYRSSRFLILESEEQLYVKVKDYYASIAYATEGVTDMSELMLKRREQQNRSGKFVPLFKQGPREEFGQGVYPLMGKFLSSMISFAGDIGYNVIISAHVKSVTKDWGKETQCTEEAIAGAPELSDGYCDIIVHFEKIFVKGQDMTKVSSQYYLSTATNLGKNRIGPDITMVNEGPKKFFEEMEKIRSTL